MARCGVCGRGFHGVSNHRRWFYYHCNSRADADVPNCGNRRVNAGEIERLVWNEIERFAERPGKVVRQLVPWVVVSPREGGRVKVSAALRPRAAELHLELPGF